MSSHKLFFLILSILLCCFVTNAQEAYKLPDVTRLRCDLGEIAQLDDAAQQIVEKNAKAIFIIYGMKGTATRYINYLQKGFWKLRYPDVNFSKFVSMRYGGYNEISRMEIWVVPQGAKESVVNNPSIEKNATMFDSYGYWYQYCDDERMPALKVFADELKQKTNSTGYIVVHYEKDNSAETDAEMMTSVHKGQRASLTDKNLLTKLGVKSSRIFTIDVDYDKLSHANHAELWIVPSNASLPKLVLINKD